MEEEVKTEEKVFSLPDIVDENLEEIISIIKDTYPDIDIFSKMRYTDSAAVKAAVEATKKKYPGVKLFYIDIPYYGVVIYRSQSMKDTREIATESVLLSEKLIEENGGADNINKMEDLAKRQISKSIQEQTNDFINLSMLKRCVLFPDSFAPAIETENIPYGVIPVLLDVLAESSGFQNVKIEEI